MREKLTRPARLAAVGVLVVIALALTGCGGDSSKSNDDKDPLEVLTLAKANFDKASSVHFGMSTTSKPDGGDAVLGADGVLTRQPAFEGDVKVLFSGFEATVPITSVDGKVYAKLPLTPRFEPIDPSDYGAPDPATFFDPASGISGLLLELEGLKKEGTVRDGKRILTTYAGTLDGSLVKGIIPSADSDSTFETVVGIDDDDRIATLSVTGDFFSGSGAVTFDLSFDSYDENVTITKP